MKKYFAEIFGTFWLVFGGCGSAILAGGGIGLVGISLAFGLTVLTMAYAVGHISGGHFNPAVSIGLWAGGKFSGKDLPGYIVSQLVGAILAAGALYFIVTGSDKEIGGFAANGYDSLSPGGFSMMSAFIAEFLLTAFFLLVILGSTNKRAPKGFAPMAIGLCLTLIHLISIPITNTSVNPARSSSQALFAGGDYLPQTWLFWVAPILGAIVAGFIHKALFDKE
ncbi:aquaporin Z [Kordia sp.]|uniref:aquaporin Z n=1 Tax=Kordia sp. TaxID=1965332 RepID=UPI003D6B9386